MSSNFNFNSSSEADTCRLGTNLGKIVTGGLVIALNGQLGAGKTHFVRAFCDGLGIHDELVNSPTFVLMQSYTTGRLPVCHFDTYRLGDVDEFLAIGAEEYLNDSQVVCLIEWAEIVEEALPADHLAIRLEHTGPTSRRIHLQSSGPQSDAVLKALENAES